MPHVLSGFREKWGIFICPILEPTDQLFRVTLPRLVRAVRQ